MSKCTLSYHVPGCDCKRPSFAPLFRLTEAGKVYVLKSIKSGRYVTQSKGKRGEMYFGLYIGQAGKRYGAARFEGGPELTAKLALPGNSDLIAVEVEK